MRVRRITNCRSNTNKNFTVQPADQTATCGDVVTFSPAVTGTESLTYQWQKNGINLNDGGYISGSTSNRLTISTVEAADAGTYALVASNSFGVATSSNVVLTVNPDVSNPTVTITAPAATAVFTNTPLTWSGTATDNVRVSQVLVMLNGVTNQSGVVLGAKPSTATWSIPVALSAGPNRLSW